MSLSRPFQLLGLTTLSLLLTIVFFVFGAVPMRWMDRRFGRAWTSFCHLGLVSLLLVTGNYEYAWILFGLLTLVLSYSFFETELRLKGKFWLGALSVGLSAGVSALLLGLWGMLKGQENLAGIRENFHQRWTEVSASVGAGSSGLDAEQVLMLMPGILLSCWIAALILALVWDAPKRWKGANKTLPLDLTFSVPDVFVGITIVSLLGGFYPFEGYPTLKVVSYNALLVCGFLFMVQGLAVVTGFLKFWRLPVFFRTVLLVLLLLNPYVLAAIGFSDYWVEYRPRFLMNKKEIKSRGENS